MDQRSLVQSVDGLSSQQRGRCLLVRNAPSPAATSLLAIAEYPVDQLLAEE